MNEFTKKILLCLSLLLVVISVRAEDVTVVARIHSLKEAEDALKYPVVLENEGMSATLKKLGPSDDVLLKGHIEYHPVTHEGRTEMNPTFHVEKVIPVSLEKIGKVEYVPMESKITFTSPTPYAPGTLPVTGKVAGAITLTATLLLLKDLSNNQVTQPQADQLNNRMIFSAGALATGLYLWEQLKGKKSKD